MENEFLNEDDENNKNQIKTDLKFLEKTANKKKEELKNEASKLVQRLKASKNMA